MKVFLVFLIIWEITVFGKEAKLKDVEECKNGMLQFSRFEGTSGKYDEVIARGNQFVTLQDQTLTIFDNFKPIHQKKLMISKRRLNLDLFKNILFTFNSSLGIYIPENDEIIWKESPYVSYNLTGNQVFDDNNTIYSIINGTIFHAKTTDKFFKSLPRLERFKNVTNLVRGDGGHIYFAHASEKTSWIVNTTTEQTIMQTRLLKCLNFVWGNYGGDGYLSLVDTNCTLKSSRIFSSFDVHQPNLEKTIQFEYCNYSLDARFILSCEGTGDVAYFFNKNSVYRTLLRSNSEYSCLIAKLGNINITAAAINNNYIILATSDGLWFSKWW
ncbi:uncharacterized protein LOC117171360 [Belonocnema kinseyi]|uniref:uncharacterized protein LOC117171360 n=1 Tax=Belonocnema kinseyi TaxID=2817044 RepID=UPI00143D2D90|nr:uncharacterized protein LOC117171360 [Belonocnema kinseyi]